MDGLISQLLESPEVSVRWQTQVRILGKAPDAALAEAVRSSPRVQTLLAACEQGGYHVYQKWCGAHWVLAALADLGYPWGDERLMPLREQVCGWLLSRQHDSQIRVIAGRVRRCASQESNALFSLLRLGLADERCEQLAARLISWQWPDGGWNCDKRAPVTRSSFHETLLPLRALNCYAGISGDPAAQRAVERAAEVFLSRRLFRRLQDGAVMEADFLRLHYPAYWHYEVLSGLVAMTEAGLIGDPRCTEALDWLESRQLAAGGFPADARYYRVTRRQVSGGSPVDWGPADGKQRNDFVSVSALYVLRAAGRA